MPSTLLTCVPNVSEGRDPDRIAELVRRSAHPAVRLLHQTSDPDHNRTVFTWLGEADALCEASSKLLDAAIATLDLRDHRGVHPRVGLLDVVPFVPAGATPMQVAIDAANRAARSLSSRVPVFLYEESASKPERRNLATHRRGGLSGLDRRMRDGSWPPDLGPSSIDPRYGATVIGARRPIVAFNVFVSPSDAAAARRIAGRIRASAPNGLSGVKALGLALERRNCSQISMNVVALDQIDLVTILQRIADEAEREGIEVLGSELIGLLPHDAVLGALRSALQQPDLAATDLLDHHLLKS